MDLLKSISNEVWTLIAFTSSGREFTMFPMFAESVGNVIFEKREDVINRHRIFQRSKVDMHRACGRF